MTDTQPTLPTDTVELPSPPEPRRHRELLRRTILEGLMLCLVSLLVGTIIQMLHLGVFLASEENTKAISAVLKINPLLLVAAGLIAAPILEELLFRGLPYWLYSRFTRLKTIAERTNSRSFWIVGSIVAVLFAIMHGPGNLPVPQLMVGLWSWHVINTRGLRYSMVLHASYNFLPVLLATAYAYAPVAR